MGEEEVEGEEKYEQAVLELQLYETIVKSNNNVIRSIST